MTNAKSPRSDSKLGFTLKTIGPESATILSQLWQRTFRDAYFKEHSEEDITKYCLDNYSIVAARETLKDNNILCKLSYRQNSPVGLYVLKDHNCPLAPDTQAYELKQLYLLASEYGQGLAGILFNDICLHAKEQNCPAIWLSVSDKNKRAQAYYHKQGFKILGNGPTFNVGKDTLSSKILILEL